MNAATLDALAAFPAQLEALYGSIPEDYVRWAPQSWDGIPSETFNPLGQICHVRDIEIDGYQVRFHRALNESNPLLATIDGYLLARERAYAQTDPAKALAEFRAAREQTVGLLMGLNAEQLARPAIFEDYGALCVRSLIHFLSSHDQQHLAGLQWLLGKISMERENCDATSRLAAR